MDKCWASPVGNCSGKLTKEHLISKSLLGSGIIISGLPWCKGKEIKLGTNSLTGKILCKQHNNDLSIYDAAAKTFFDAIKKMNYDVKSWCHSPQKNSKGSSQFIVDYSKLDGWLKNIKIPIQFYVDYSKLEKWFLKTMINIMLAKRYSLNIDKLLPYLFENKPFKKPYGLYTYTFNTDRESSNTLLKIDFKFNVNEKQGNVTGAIITFKGFKFLFVFSKQIHGVEPIHEIQDRWHNPEIIQSKIPFQNLVTHVINFHNK